MTTTQLKHLAKRTLSNKRYQHEKNVAKKAKELAIKYGANEEDAEKAAWIHDLLKEKNKDILLNLLKQNDIINQTIDTMPVPILHGPAAAIYAQKELGIDDQEILSAVACHTTGKEDMSILDKVLYVADAISEERDYSGVEELRMLANESLDKAVVAIMEHTINHLQSAGRKIDEQSLKALEQMKQKIN